MRGRQALNHIYKDLVSIVITQSTDKGRGEGEGGGSVCVCACVYACVLVDTYMLRRFLCMFVCVCVSVRARIDLRVYICVYPCEEKRKGIIFSLVQGPVYVHVCACLWACVYVGDWAFEGDSRLRGVIMRTNAELYCNQDAYDMVSKRDKQYGENLHCISFLYLFCRLFNVIAALRDIE